MPMIVGVKFGGKGKQYSFDPLNIDFKEGEGVVVETVRGLEYARVTQSNTLVSDEEIKTPLKPVIRKATQEDDARAKEKRREEKKAR